MIEIQSRTSCEDISKIISKYKMYMSFDGNEYEMIQKVELNKIFEEIERLNNIINELEKHLEHEIKEYKENGYDILEIRRANLWLTGCYDEDKEILNKLQELKGSDKE